MSCTPGTCPHSSSSSCAFDLAAEPAFLKTEHGRNSLVYGDGWILKFFRRIEVGTNPDLEVGRFLAERTTFTQAPPLAGAIEYRQGQAEPMTLALLEGLVANEGNAWQYTVDALGRYFEQMLTHKSDVHDITLPQRQLLDAIPGRYPARPGTHRFLPGNGPAAGTADRRIARRPGFGG